MMFGILMFNILKASEGNCRFRSTFRYLKALCVEQSVSGIFVSVSFHLTWNKNVLILLFTSHFLKCVCL